MSFQHHPLPGLSLLGHLGWPVSCTVEVSRGSRPQGAHQPERGRNDHEGSPSQCSGWGTKRKKDGEIEVGRSCHAPSVEEGSHRRKVASRLS